MATKNKKKKITIGKVYTAKKNLSYKKKLTKKESKKYTKLEKKAKKVVAKANKTLKAYVKKLSQGGLTKSEKAKIKNKKKALRKSVKNSKSVKALNTYKKKLDKSYSKKTNTKKSAKKTTTVSKATRAKNIRNTIQSKAKNRAYMIDEDTGKTFIFQFNPEKVPYERKVSYNTIDAPGQAYPQTQFAKGDGLEFTVELFMYTPIVRQSVSAISGGSVQKSSNLGNLKTSSIEGGVAANDNISTARTFLEGLMPPMSNSSGFVRPHTCTFAFGYFVKTNCVVTSLKVEDERLDSLGQPVQTKFTVTLRKV